MQKAKEYIINRAKIDERIGRKIAKNIKNKIGGVYYVYQIKNFNSLSLSLSL